MMSTRRTRLNPATSRSQMLLGDWMKGGYASERAFVEAFNAPRPKQTGTQRSVGGSFAKLNKEASGATVIEVDHDDDENENEDVVMGGDGNEQQMEMDVDV
jgi:hypothetical protein